MHENGSVLHKFGKLFITSFVILTLSPRGGRTSQSLGHAVESSFASLRMTTLGGVRGGVGAGLRGVEHQFWFGEALHGCRLLLDFTIALTNRLVFKTVASANKIRITSKYSWSDCFAFS